MARPRKGEPRPDTELVAFRFSRALLREIDEHAKRMSSTRSDAARDLVQRGLGTVSLPSKRSSPSSPAKRPSKATPPKPVPSKDVSSPAAGSDRVVMIATSDCVWCGSKRGKAHAQRCPRATGSLDDIFRIGASVGPTRRPRGRRPR